MPVDECGIAVPVPWILAPRLHWLQIEGFLTSFEKKLHQEEGKYRLPHAGVRSCYINTIHDELVFPLMHFRDSRKNLTSSSVWRAVMPILMIALPRGAVG